MTVPFYYIFTCSSNLTWRDVQHITILSANSTIVRDEQFITNAAGLNCKYMQ